MIATGVAILQALMVNRLFSDLAAATASPRRGDGQPRPAPGTPDITALLVEGGGQREQPAATESSSGGLNAVADHAVNHRLPERPLGCIVGGLEPFLLQESPESLTSLE